MPKLTVAYSGSSLAVPEPAFDAMHASIHRLVQNRLVFRAAPYSLSAYLRLCDDILVIHDRIYEKAPWVVYPEGLTLPVLHDKLVSASVAARAKVPVQGRIKWGPELKIFIRPDWSNVEEVTIINEVISFTKHPMSDRCATTKVLRNVLPGTEILATNPDRLSRRPEELVEFTNKGAT